MTQQNLTHLKKMSLLFATVALLAGTARGSVIYLPNNSFEQPPVPPVNPFAQPDLDYWQKAPQPSWYNPANYNFTPWEYNMGAFYNVPFPGSYIDNCDGAQAAYMFALPDIALFQDYNTIYGTHTTPSHAFNAKYNVGR